LHLLAIPVERRNVVPGANVRALLEHGQDLFVDLFAFLDVGGRPTVGYELVELGVAELAILPGRSTFDATLQDVAVDQRLKAIAGEAELEFSVADDADVTVRSARASVARMPLPRTSAERIRDGVLRPRSITAAPRRCRSGCPPWSAVLRLAGLYRYFRIDSS
jgi:hypothetical protein